MELLTPLPQSLLPGDEYELFRQDLVARWQKYPRRIVLRDSVLELAVQLVQSEPNGPKVFRVRTKDFNGYSLCRTPGELFENKSFFKLIVNQTEQGITTVDPVFNVTEDEHPDRKNTELMTSVINYALITDLSRYVPLPFRRFADIRLFDFNVSKSGGYTAVKISVDYHKSYLLRNLGQPLHLPEENEIFGIQIIRFYWTDQGHLYALGRVEKHVGLGTSEFNLLLYQLNLTKTPDCQQVNVGAVTNVNAKSIIRMFHEQGADIRRKVKFFGRKYSVFWGADDSHPFESVYNNELKLFNNTNITFSAPSEVSPAED